MPNSANHSGRTDPQPLPENIHSIQPGGGVCYDIELAWGRWRRWWLKTFRPGYVQKMAALRKGDASGCPHEILDPRDLKYYRNQCNAAWSPADDPFRWREKIPFARWGLAELFLIGFPLLIATVLLAWLAPAPYGYLAIGPGVLFVLVVNFFRDPPRRLTTGAGLYVSPADGKVVEITKIAHDEFIGGPAVRIGMFLTIFNVHVNRMPIASRVLELKYNPGRFMSATNPESALVNENMWMGFEEEAVPHRRYIMRQISGGIARRIVCDLRMGESLEQGHKFGMIKLGSRAEVLVADVPGLEIVVPLNKWVKAGRDVLCRFA